MMTFVNSSSKCAVLWSPKEVLIKGLEFMLVISMWTISIFMQHRLEDLTTKGNKRHTRLGCSEKQIKCSMKC